MTCRDIARIGQVLINKGKWAGPSGSVVTLVSEEWAAAMSAPSMPSVASSYGYLTYNNHAPPSLPGCCSPRWSEPPWTGCPGYAYGHNRNMHETAYLGDDLYKQDEAAGSLVPLAPPDVIISVGNMAKYLFTIPSRDMVVVSMGSTWGSSAACNVNLFPNYDEAISGSVMWEAFGKLTQPHTTSMDKVGGPTYGVAEGEAEDLEADTQHTEVQPATAVLPPPYTVPTCRFHPPVLQKDRSKFYALSFCLWVRGVQLQEPEQGRAAVGSCYCYCPPDRTTGQCYPASSASECSAMLPKGGEPGACSGTGVVKQVTLINTLTRTCMHACMQCSTMDISVE
jgi:hypothetical protein